MVRPVITSALSSILFVTVAAQAQTTPAPADQQQERRICRAMDRPGSLAGSRRVCMTRAEWDRAAEQARRTGEMMIAGQDSCAARAEGGSQISGSFSQQNAAAMQRMSSGC